MEFLYAIFFGAGVAGVAYTRLGRRVGYDNSQNVWLVTGAIFLLATAVFFTIFAFFISD